MKRRILALAALAALAVAGPVAGAGAAAKKKAKPSPGLIYGAVTSQGYPVVIELAKNGRKVVFAGIGLEVKCQMPPDITIPDGFEDLPIKAGRFTGSQPVMRLPADPATGLPAIDVSATMTGRLNKARTSIRGTWQRKVVIYDPADPTGARVLDTCDTGVLNFRARQ